MEIKCTDIALEHLAYFKKINERGVLKKIKQLLEDINSHQYSGIGKPEQLRYQYKGYWSRRVNREHRMIYKIDKENNRIVIYSLKGLY